MRSVSSGNIIAAPAPNFNEITQKVGSQEEFSQEKAQGIAGDIKAFVSTEQTITPEQAQKLLSIVANLEKAGIKDLAEVKASLTTLAKPQDGVKAPQKDPPPVNKAFVKDAEPKGAIINDVKAEIIGGLEELEAEPELKKAKNISTDKLLISSIKSLDFVKPTHSGLDNFLRGLKNFIKNIFTPWIHYKTLGEEDLAKRAAEFGKQNSRLIWQLMREGKEQKVVNALTYYIDEANHNMSSGEVLQAVDVMMGQFKKAAKSWQKENLDYISDLPKGHPSKMFLKESLPAIAKKYDINLSGISADVERRITDNILDRLKTADEIIPEEQFAETAQRIISEELKAAKEITEATKKGHVLAEIKEPKTTNDYVNNLCSMLAKGIPDLDTFLAQNHAASMAIYKDSAAKFLEVLKNKPHKEYGPDDQLWDKQQMLTAFLHNLSDEQLKAIATTLTSPTYEALCDDIYRAYDHLDGHRVDPYDARAAKLYKKDMETLRILQVAVSELMQKRGIAEGFNFEPKAAKNENTYSFLQDYVAAFTGSIRLETKATFEEYTDEILKGIISPETSEEQLENLFMEMRLSFDEGLVDEEKIMLQIQEDFNSYFSTMLGERIKHLGAQDLLTLYRGINSPKFMTLRIKANHDLGETGDPRKGMLLSSLNIIEEMVNMEIAERAIFNNEKKSDGLTGQQAAILASADQAGFKQELSEQKDEFLAGKAGEWQDSTAEEDHKMQEQYGITPAQFQEVIDSTDFTINIPPSLIFGNDSPFFKNGKLQPEALKLKNVFQLPNDERGDLYKKRRVVTEQALYPQMKSFEKSEDPKAENHPISGALNIGKLEDGAAASYSQDLTTCHVVLKNEVKKRTRFTPRDAFHSLRLQINDKNIAKMRNLLKEVRAGTSKYGQFTPQFAAQFDDAAIEAFLNDLNTSFPSKTLVLGSKEFRGDRLDLIVQDRIKLKTDDDKNGNNQELIALLTLMAFTEKSSDVPVSLDNIKKLFKYRNDMYKGIAEMANDPDNSTFSFNDYIEGEIFGGVDLTKDITEIVFNSFRPQDFPDYKDRVAQLEKIGIKVTVKI